MILTTAKLKATLRRNSSPARDECLLLLCPGPHSRATVRRRLYRPLDLFDAEGGRAYQSRSTRCRRDLRIASRRTAGAGGIWPAPSQNSEPPHLRDLFRLSECGPNRIATHSHSPVYPTTRPLNDMMLPRQESAPNEIVIRQRYSTYSDAFQSVNPTRNSTAFGG